MAGCSILVNLAEQRIRSIKGSAKRAAATELGRVSAWKIWGIFWTLGAFDRPPGDEAVTSWALKAGSLATYARSPCGLPRQRI